MYWFLNALFSSMGCSTLVRQHPMKSLSTICLSLCPSVCLSVTKFSKDWVISFFLIFYMIANHDTVSSDWQPIFEKKKKKKKLVSQIWAKCSKIGQNFLNFDSLAFLEIAYNDSLQLCLTCSRGKIHEK